jgi:hypothetical protein
VQQEKVMSDPGKIQSEQITKRKDWVLPWLVLSVLGGGMLGGVLYAIYSMV